MTLLTDECFQKTQVIFELKFLGTGCEYSGILVNGSNG